ncbi:MAG: terpene cyclase/mutase family protein [Planctomycetes bacterium]|nr:terpene cyclase/mutase family protein [Planctomycetota bacterium]
MLLLLCNSPWLSMAVLLHVMIFVVFSVIYLTREQSAERQKNLAVSIAATPLQIPPALEEPSELIDRSRVPILLTEKERSVDLDPAYISDADPGRVGEITPGVGTPGVDTDEIDLGQEAGLHNPDPEALSSLPSGATGGTPIGVGSVGHVGTGAPSAYVGRLPGGGGKGGGGPTHGGGGASSATRQATDAALVWLAQHQSPDGRWSATGFAEQCRKNECSGRGNDLHDTGLTALALLCFLGAGETHQTSVFKDTIKRGLVHLLSLQEESEDGCFGERIGQHWVYNHACAALALAEAYGMTGAKALKEPAQRGINFILVAQNPYSAWRYAYPPDGDSDSSVTGWMVMALKSAALSRLTIDRVALDNALSFIDEITDPLSGRTGYTALGGTPARLPSLARAFPAD